MAAATRRVQEASRGPPLTLPIAAAAATNAAVLRPTVISRPVYVTGGKGTTVPGGIAGAAAGAAPVDSEDVRWFNQLLLELWPRICEYVGELMKAAMIQVSAAIHTTLPASFFSDIDAFVAHIKKHPLPLPPRLSWVNQTLKDLWDLLRPTFQKFVKEVLVPRIQSKLPPGLNGFDIDPCTIGVQPPMVTQIEVSPRSQLTSEGQSDSIHIVLALRWHSDLDIGLKGLRLIKMGIEGVKLDMEMHISLMNLLDRPPFIGGISVWVVNPPSFALDWTGILDVLDLSVFETLIHREVNEGLGKFLVLPKRIGIGMDPECDIFRMKHPRPQGVLKVSILGASGLRTDDFGVATLWNKQRTSDPYVWTEFGAETWRTATIQKSTGEASWSNEARYFLVNEFFDQRFNFTVLDEDKTSGDDPLARRRDVSLPVLMGLSSESGSVPLTRKEHTHSIKLEVLWANKLAAEKTAEKLALEGGRVVREQEEGSTAEKAATKAVEAGRKAAGTAAGARSRVSTAWGRRTGADEASYENLDSQLKLQVTWIPLELNETVARIYTPGMMHEPFAALLFVGIYGCHDLVHQTGAGTAAHKTLEQKYWARVTCSGSVNVNGTAIEDGSEEAWKPTGKRLKDPRKDKGMESEEDKRDDHERKVMQLLENGVPPEVVAEVLEITVDEIATIQREANEITTDFVDIMWEEGFDFLLIDPKASTATVEICMERPGISESVLGSVTYKVSSLLEQPALTETWQGPLRGGHPRSCLLAKFQLRTLFMGSQYPARVPHGPTEAEKKAAAGLNKAVRQRVVYLDRMGGQRTQVNGIWVEEEPNPGGRASLQHHLADEVGHALHQGVAAVENVAGKMLHGFEDMVHGMADRLHVGHHADAGQDAAPAGQQPGQADDAPAHSAEAASSSSTRPSGLARFFRR